MTIPIHLEHRPIVAVDRYNEIDGPFAPNSDAQALSLGWAQYDAADFSAKVFRQVNGQWSRQSEELPMHRVLDLGILILGSMTQRPAPVTNLRDELMDSNSIGQLRNYFQSQQVTEILRPRLEELRRLLSLRELVNY